MLQPLRGRIEDRIIFQEGRGNLEGFAWGFQQKTKKKIPWFY